MKRQIRRGTFETNSSSTHAICITKSDVDKANLPNYVEFEHWLGSSRISRIAF